MVLPQCACKSKLQQYPEANLCDNRVSRDVFRSLIFGEKNKLSNRNLLAAEFQSATSEISKSPNGTLDVTLNCNLVELALLRFVKDCPDATQIEIAKHIGKSERTVKRMTPALIERGLLERENGKRNGKWVVKCEI